MRSQRPPAFFSSMRKCREKANISRAGESLRAGSMDRRGCGPNSEKRSAGAKVRAVSCSISLTRKLARRASETTNMRRRSPSGTKGIQCSSCLATLPEAAKFCIKCGAPAPSVCSACGFSNVAYANFCAECGAKLAAVRSNEVQTAPPFASSPFATDVNLASVERRQLTVLFCDLVGSTALSSRLDPEELRVVIGTYHRCIADTVERFGGFVARYMGDGALVYFGFPHAYEDNAERAVRSALALSSNVARLDALPAQPQPPISARGRWSGVRRNWGCFEIAGNR